MFRKLNDDEIQFVAGGQDVEEYTITATKQQKIAADIAYDRAWTDYTIYSSIGMGIVAGYGYAAGAIAGAAGAGATIGIGASNQAASMMEDPILDYMTQHYYDMDGADGKHDGNLELFPFLLVYP